MIILPVVLLAVWLVLQLAMVMHVQHVAEAAAQDAALAAASASGDPRTVAADLMARSAGSLSADVGSHHIDRRADHVVARSVIQIFPRQLLATAASAPAEGASGMGHHDGAAAVG